MLLKVAVPPHEVSGTGIAVLLRICSVAAMSPFHFQRMFKSAFGISPMQFVQRRRLERARYLLTKTEEPVTSICLAVGFESLGSFSALFKRTFGVSPREIRRFEEVFARERL